MNLRRDLAGWPLAVALAWFWTWWHLAGEWRVNPEYQYGFAVPLLFLYTAWRRWSGPMRPPGSLRVCPVVVFCAAWISLLLGELLRRHDPIWRLTGALLLLGSVLLTAVWFHRAGGSPLLRRQRFSLGFAFLALPWPVPMDVALTQTLLHFVTTVSVVLVNTLGIAALQHGNIIEISNGSLGMENACSGVDSFQSALVASLFLGELFWLGSVRRWVLIGGGWVIAFGANLARVCCLLLLIHARGEAGAAAKHDLIGGSATACTFLAIFGLAVWLGRRIVSLEPVAGPDGAHAGAEGWGVCVAVASIPLLVAAWFSALGVPVTEMPAAPRWHLDESALPPGWFAKSLEPSVEERAVLRFSRWECLFVRLPEGDTAKIIHIFWEPGKSMPGMAFYHTPALCLPSVGWQEIRPPQIATLQHFEEQLPCVSYGFDWGGSRRTVYQCLSRGGKTDPFFVTLNLIGNRRDRLSMLWSAPRRQVNEELLIYMSAFDDATLQDKAATKLLETVLKSNNLSDPKPAPSS